MFLLSFRIPGCIERGWMFPNPLGNIYRETIPVASRCLPIAAVCRPATHSHAPDEAGAKRNQETQRSQCAVQQALCVDKFAELTIVKSLEPPLVWKAGGTSHKEQGDIEASAMVAARSSDCRG
eukprot:5912108-Amphidinium_carterae.1